MSPQAARGWRLFRASESIPLSTNFIGRTIKSPESTTYRYEKPCLKVDGNDAIDEPFVILELENTVEPIRVHGADGALPAVYLELLQRSTRRGNRELAANTGGEARGAPLLSAPILLPGFTNSTQLAR